MAQQGNPSLGESFAQVQTPNHCCQAWQRHALTSKLRDVALGHVNRKAQCAGMAMNHEELPAHEHGVAVVGVQNAGSGQGTMGAVFVGVIVPVVVVGLGNI